MSNLSRKNKPMKRKLIRHLVENKQPIVCFWCHGPFTSFRRMTVDHVQALGEGGKHKFENTVLACPQCNNERGAQTSKRLQESDPDKHARPRPQRSIQMTFNELTAAIVEYCKIHEKEITEQAELTSLQVSTMTNPENWLLFHEATFNGITERDFDFRFAFEELKAQVVTGENDTKIIEISVERD